MFVNTLFIFIVTVCVCDLSLFTSSNPNRGGRHVQEENINLFFLHIETMLILLETLVETNKFVRQFLIRFDLIYWFI